jgi:transposase
MLTPGRNVKVFAYREPVDMRRGFNGLYALARDVLGLDPLSGHYFLFVGRSRRLAKVLRWDGTGLCIFSKRLERHRFVGPWQREGDGQIEMTASELALLLEGSAASTKVLSPPPVTQNSQKNAF